MIAGIIITIEYKIITKTLIFVANKIILEKLKYIKTPQCRRIRIPPIGIKNINIEKNKRK